MGRLPFIQEELTGNKRIYTHKRDCLGKPFSFKMIKNYLFNRKEHLYAGIERTKSACYLNNKVIKLNFSRVNLYC